MRYLKLFMVLSFTVWMARAEEEAAQTPTDETATPATEIAAPSPEAAPVSAPAQAETAALPTPAASEPAPAASATAAETPAPVFVVLMPEQVDTEWFWYYYSDTAQHIAQSAVERALINGGFDVVDLASIKKLDESGSLSDVTTTDGARRIAREANATYAIVGTATAVKGSQNEAYGVTVIRSSAEITAKIIRVSDGKVLAVETASAQKGGQAARAAGQEAIKTASDQLARKLLADVRRITATP